MSKLSAPVKRFARLTLAKLLGGDIIAEIAVCLELNLIPTIFEENNIKKYNYLCLFRFQYLRKNSELKIQIFLEEFTANNAQSVSVSIAQISLKMSVGISICKFVYTICMKSSNNSYKY